MGETVNAGAPGARGWWALLGLVAAFTAVYLAFYPTMIGIEDEVQYLNQALVWTRGAVTAEGAGFLALAGYDLDRTGSFHVPVRQPGRSLLLLPFFAAGGERAAFLSGLLIHLLIVGAGAAVLDRLGRSPLWAALLLFHPTLALFSRTLMADNAAGLGLLLAALALATTDRPFMGALGGLAVGFGALVRYHAGLALPFIALGFRFPPARRRPGREAALCLVTGGASGAAILAYNLWLYHHPTDAAPGMRGHWSAGHFFDQVRFYVAALLLIWPGMLVAPLLDRSVLRWAVRGVCYGFLAMFLVYYWHEQDFGRLESLVVGQRLLMVALPLWVVSYAGVVDDWVAAPLRRALGPRAVAAVVAAACLGLLAGTGVIFAKHQRHLGGLRLVRDEIVRNVPDGSLIATSGPVYKLVGTPGVVPVYFFLPVDWAGHLMEAPDVLDRRLDAAPRPYFLAVLRRSPAEPTPEYLDDLVRRRHLTPVSVSAPLLSLYRSPGGRSVP